MCREQSHDRPIRRGIEQRLRRRRRIPRSELLKSECQTNTKEPASSRQRIVPPEGGQPDTPPPAPTSTVNSNDGGAVDRRRLRLRTLRRRRKTTLIMASPMNPPRRYSENYGSAQPEQSPVQQSIEAPGLAGHQQTIDAPAGNLERGHEVFPTAASSAPTQHTR